MKSFFFLIALTVVSLNSVAHADGWTPRLACGNGELIIDGYQTFERGLMGHQMVIRNLNTAKYFQSLIQSPLPINAKSELIFDLKTATFDGKFNTQITDVVYNSPSKATGVLYGMRGHWDTSPGRYMVEVLGLNVYPGMTYHEPTQLGNWVFDNCRWIR